MDPSLTTVGWSASDVEGNKIENFHVGKISPPKSGSTVERVKKMLDDVKDVFYERVVNGIAGAPVEIVIEIPSGRTTMRHKGGGYGLAKYGFAVGSLWQMFHIMYDANVHAVDENWTGSRSKDARQKIAFKHHPLMKRLKDPGMDMSDAVALAVWWAQIGRKKLKGVGA